MHVLTDSIIPVLELQQICQLAVGPSFHSDKVPHWTWREAPLPDQQQTFFDFLTHWKDDYMLAQNIHRISFIYSGANDNRWGVTETMAQQLKAAGDAVPPGVTAYRVVAPCIYYVLPGIPRNDGRYPYRARELEQYGKIGELTIAFTPDEIFLSHVTEGRHSSHWLCVSERRLTEKLKQYTEMLKARQYEKCQLLMHEILNLLMRVLKQQPLRISNSAYPSLKEIFTSFSVQATGNNFKICADAVRYIQLHLNTSLNCGKVAAAAGVSPRHMNRVFNAEFQMTTMQFVTQYRLAAAKDILKLTDERISDIARLVGFSSTQSMDVVFRRANGMSPKAYRHQ